MTRLDQSQLQRQVEIFVTNGKQATVQNIMIGIGYNAAALDAGQLKLQDWLSLKTTALALLAAQKQATQTELEARRAAQTELVSLIQTVRVLFEHNPTIMTSLDLLIHHHSSAVVAEPESDDEANAAEPGHSNTPAHSGASKRLAVNIARWRLLLTNLSTLTEAERAELTQAGWGPERIAAAANLVEVCATADTAQKQKTQAYRAAAAAAHEAEVALHKWYSQAVRLTRLAIKQADPANRERWEGLLGL